MAGQTEIAAAINAATAGTAWTAWRIGLTHDPETRRRYWAGLEDTTRWAHWRADSLPDAKQLEDYFTIVKKMRGVNGGVLSPDKPVYVFVF